MKNKNLVKGRSRRNFQGEETSRTELPKGSASRLAHALERGQGTVRGEWQEMRSGKGEPERRSKDRGTEQFVKTPR